MTLVWTFSQKRQLPFGHRLYLTGDCPTLGNWTTFIPMHYQDHHWYIKLPLPFPHPPIHYKYLVSNFETCSDWQLWDPTPNRQLDLSKISQDNRSNIASFNIRYENEEDKGELSWNKRKEKVVSRVYGGYFGVVCLQEVMPAQFQYLEKQMPLGYTGIWQSRQPYPSEGLAMIYDNQNYLVLEHGFIPIGKFGHKSFGAGCPRIIQYMILSTIGDQKKRMGVFNCHLDHRSEQARKEGANLLRCLALQKEQQYSLQQLFIMGDFNCAEDSPELESLRESPLGMVRQIGKRMATFESEDVRREVIDHIFILNEKKGGLEVDQQQKCSDHSLIWTTIYE